MSEENHIATAADFRAAHEIGRKIERVVLPKLGKAVLMRRPSPGWFIFRGQFPATLAAVATASNPDAAISAEQLRQYAKWTCELLDQVMVKPRVSLAPGPEEISPDLLADEDLNFIIRWSMGEVASDGSDLSSFRGKRGTADSRAVGAAVALPSERVD